MEEKKEQGVAMTTVKTEPGSYKRLPSFRSPRDLKLTEFQKISPNNSASDAKKKVYKPNLNIQRRKPNQDVKEFPQPSSASPATASPSAKEGGRRGKKKVPNLIQSTGGVFSEGLAPSIKRWTSGGASSRFSNSDPQPMLQKPLLKGPPLKVDKEEEAAVMKQLMRDDFLDDPGMTPDSRHCPVSLPLKMAVKKEEVEDGVESGTLPRSIDDMVPLSIGQMMAQQTEASFIFLQLPYSLPKEKTFSPLSSATTAKQQAAAKTVEPQTEERCTLKQLPEGRVGKLQLLKSGKARLVLGDTVFTVDPGTQPAFKQDVITLVDLAPTAKTGSMVHLGGVTSRLILSPHWESLLSV